MATSESSFILFSSSAKDMFINVAHLEHNFVIPWKCGFIYWHVWAMDVQQRIWRVWVTPSFWRRSVTSSVTWKSVTSSTNSLKSSVISLVSTRNTNSRRCKNYYKGTTRLEASQVWKLGNQTSNILMQMYNIMQPWLLFTTIIDLLTVIKLLTCIIN